MSDTDTEGLRERLRVRLGVVRLRLRELELDATMVRGRAEEAREEEMALIELLDETPRRRPGRPRKTVDSLTVINEPETEETAA